MVGLLTPNLVYNKWHETELERWLSDHDIPYPTPADRKDLEILVKDNWQSKVVDTAAQVGGQASDNYDSVKDWIFDRQASPLRSSLVLSLTYFLAGANRL